MAADPYTAESVTRREHPQEEVDTKSSQKLYSKISFLPVSTFFFHISRKEIGVLILVIDRPGGIRPQSGSNPLSLHAKNICAH